MKSTTVYKSIIVFFILLGANLVFMPYSGADEVATGDSPVLKRIVESGVLKVGVNPLFKPFSFKNEKNEQVGIDIDIAKLLAKSLDVRLEIIVPKSFSELIPMLMDDRIDIIMAGMTINFKRSKLINFTAPYFNTGLSIMLSKVKGAELGLSDVQSYDNLMLILKARRKEDRLIIAVTRGKSPARSVPIYFPKARIVEYPTNEASAQAVADGKAHFMVHDEIFLKMWVSDNKEKALYKLVVFPEPFKPDYYGFAVRKGNQEFLNMLNVFTRELHAEGHFTGFMRKYIAAPKPAVKFNVGESDL